ncbi:hypothetical protein HK105_207831 [Polyrhizophydium stewartii]|uniref:Pentatricopeptide repeat-containing protein n=1 Tax=Polyrhizophydium stewartii TaxID=2732419 RepID=A0ABR4MZS6_9FUNG
MQWDRSGKGAPNGGAKYAAARTLKPKAPPKKARDTKGSKVNPKDSRLAKDTSDTSFEHIQKLRELIETKAQMIAIDRFEKLKRSDPAALKQLRPHEFEAFISLVLFTYLFNNRITAMGRLEAAQRIAATAKELGVTLPPSVDRSLLDGHALAGDVAGFEKLLGEMRDAGVDTETPDVLAAQSRVHLVAGDADKGMQFWTKLAEIDKTKAPHEHLIETHAFRQDVDRAVHALETLVQQFPDETPGEECLDKLFSMLIVKRDTDSLARVAKMPQLSGAWKTGDLCHRVAGALALGGRFQDALDILDARRKSGAMADDPYMLTEIVAHDALGQHDQALALFAQLNSPAYDPKIALDAGAVLVKHVGSVADADQVEKLLESHKIVSKIGMHMALVMLLRGYTVIGNLNSMHVVFDAMISYRCPIPRRTLRHVVMLVMEKESPDKAMRMIEKMLKENMPMSGPHYKVEFACTLLQDNYPELRRRIKRVNRLLELRSEAYRASRGM